MAKFRAFVWNFAYSDDGYTTLSVDYEYFFDKGRVTGRRRQNAALPQSSRRRTRIIEKERRSDAYLQCPWHAS